jgi:hypothetical protein
VITNSIKLTVTAVSASSGNVGLAEFQAYGAVCSGCAFNSTTSASTLTSTGFVSGNGAYSDLALQATATASSYSTGQGPEKVNNGEIGGYTDDDPSNYLNEWASNGELVGAWINLTWPAYYMVDSLIFYDRPNDGDWVTGGHVDFDDGSSVSIPALHDDGSATIVNLTKAVNISSLLFTVTSVGPWSNSIGLSELSVSYSQYVFLLGDASLLASAANLAHLQSSNSRQLHCSSLRCDQHDRHRKQLDYRHPNYRHDFGSRAQRDCSRFELLDWSGTGEGHRRQHQRLQGEWIRRLHYRVGFQRREGGSLAKRFLARTHRRHSNRPLRSSQPFGSRPRRYSHVVGWYFEDFRRPQRRRLGDDHQLVEASHYYVAPRHHYQCIVDYQFRWTC